MDGIVMEWKGRLCRDRTVDGIKRGVYTDDGSDRYSIQTLRIMEFCG